MEVGGGPVGGEVEGMGESSSPPRGFSTAGVAAGSGGITAMGMAAAVFERLLADGNHEAVSNPELRSLLDVHFNRLPPRFPSLFLFLFGVSEFFGLWPFGIF
jgi:hypothetical protein